MSKLAGSRIETTVTNFVVWLQAQGLSLDGLTPHEAVTKALQWQAMSNANRLKAIEEAREDPFLFPQTPKETLPHFTSRPEKCGTCPPDFNPSFGGEHHATCPHWTPFEAPDEENPSPNQAYRKGFCVDCQRPCGHHEKCDECIERFVDNMFEEEQQQLHRNNNNQGNPWT